MNFTLLFWYLDARQCRYASKVSFLMALGENGILEEKCFLYDSLLGKCYLNIRILYKNSGNNVDKRNRIIMNRVALLMRRSKGYLEIVEDVGFNLTLIKNVHNPLILKVHVDWTKLTDITVPWRQTLRPRGNRSNCHQTYPCPQALVNKI